MKYFNIKVSQDWTFTEEDIDDLMGTALYINSWCDRIDAPEGVMVTSDSISKGDTLYIYAYCGDLCVLYVLTLKKFLKGLSDTIKHIGGFSNAEDFMDGHDADTADMIIQFALFDEIRFA